MLTSRDTAPLELPAFLYYLGSVSEVRGHTQEVRYSQVRIQRSLHLFRCRSSGKTYYGTRSNSDCLSQVPGGHVPGDANLRADGTAQSDALAEVLSLTSMASNYENHVLLQLREPCSSHQGAYRMVRSLVQIWAAVEGEQCTTLCDLRRENACNCMSEQILIATLKIGKTSTSSPARGAIGHEHLEDGTRSLLLHRQLRKRSRLDCIFSLHM